MIVIGYEAKRGDGWIELGGTTFSFHTDRLVLKFYGKEILFVDASLHEREVELGFCAPAEDPQVATLRLVSPATWQTVGLGEH